MITLKLGRKWEVGGYEVKGEEESPESVSQGHCIREAVAYERARHNYPES